MKRLRDHGFTLVELAITLTVIGLVLVFSVPAFRNLSGSQGIKGAADNLAGQLRLARETAVSTGLEQPFHCTGMTVYHIHYPTGISASAQWVLPPTITFGRSMNDYYRMQPNGRVVMGNSANGSIPLVDGRGNRDTIFVESSGIVLEK
ncbi:MAG: prepilin-type N-terminal cleavage/methylation domain-containing protein [Candidatus Eisenbacteria bacterium]|nr:prepilin-type N-terminal cleavage/methylation domain-containing protein [Candidatus Eisenbacteria bacterium]